MTVRFDTRGGLIVIPAELTGPSGVGILQLALDTGATTTLVNVAMLVAIGYDPALTTDRVQVTTGSGVELSLLPASNCKKITALGQARHGLPVLGHTLPPSSGVDGLLGLDFFRGLRLTIDFRAGQLRID